MRSIRPALALTFALCPLSAAPTAAAPPEAALDPTEQQIAEWIGARSEATYALLEHQMEINSGTLNPPGVRAVGEALAEPFEELGFVIEWVELPEEMERGPHLVARRTAASQGAPHVLMIGHLDTVFEPDSPFQEAVREGDVLHGPGGLDMKGGNLAILLAVQGLAAAEVLDEVTVTALFTGDEEEPGLPLAVSRAPLEEAAKAADVALGFESGCCRAGTDRAVVARRSSIPWRLDVEGVHSHSSVIFSEEVGAGAVFEAARILDGFYEELAAEEALTFNVGLLVAGSELEHDPDELRATVSGKTNIVPGEVVAYGGLRALTPEQLTTAEERMRAIVADHRPMTSAAITFDAGYPPMPPTEGNRHLLALYDAVSRALGLGPVEAFPPAERGAADVSFAAPWADALGGLGPEGSGSHTPDERVVLPTIVESAQRAALLLYRLGTVDAE